MHTPEIQATSTLAGRRVQLPGHFVWLIDPRIFPPPHRFEEHAQTIRHNSLGLGGDSPWALRRSKEDLRDAQGRRLSRKARALTFRRPVRRIEVKGRTRGQPVRMTTNRWLKARQLGKTYCLYVVWDPLEPGAEPISVQDPAQGLEYAAREVLVVAGYEMPAEAVERARSAVQ